jgi:hypothetical protein
MYVTRAHSFDESDPFYRNVETIGAGDWRARRRARLSVIDVAFCRFLSLLARSPTPIINATNNLGLAPCVVGAIGILPALRLMKRTLLFNVRIALSRHAL